MEAIILAAGYATRLYPLTKNWPKALLTNFERFPFKIQGKYRVDLAKAQTILHTLLNL